LCLVLGRLTDEQDMHFQTAANSFLDQPRTLNSAQSVHRGALREGFPQIFDECILRARDWAKSS